MLVAADCFPSLHFLLAGLAERHGFRLDTVPLRPGESWVREEDFIERWTADVGVALVTQVTSTASYRCDLPVLVAHGRRIGSLVGVDVTQGIGLIPYDAQAPEVDFTVSTSLKWLSGTAGAGILHVRAGAAARMPTAVARLVQPGESVLLGSERVRLCARRAPLRSRHAVRRRMRRHIAGAGVACEAGRPRAARS